MGEPVSLMVVGGSAVIALALIALAALKAMNVWAELKRLEIEQGGDDANLPPLGGRIELADLKERVRKLEAIAAGIDP